MALTPGDTALTLDGDVVYIMADHALDGTTLVADSADAYLADAYQWPTNELQEVTAD